MAMSAVGVIGSRQSGKETVSPQPKLLDRLREALRSRQYRSRNENIYCYWVKHSLPMSTTMDRLAFAIRWTGFETIKGGHVMPIRIRCREKPLNRTEPTENKGIRAPPAAVSTACYTDRKTQSRILCGSI